MFSKLYNEALITFTMETMSPLFIKASEDSTLDPTAAYNTYMAFYKDGKQVPVIPGTSIKGVFRSSAEELIRALGLEPCNVLERPCGRKIGEKLGKEDKKDVKKIYSHCCPICKLFGTTTLKSRVYFFDAYVEEGDYKIGKRTSVGIDRVTGASKRGALFDFEYVEYGKFKTQIKLKNFFGWQLKLLFDLFDRVNDGRITFGGLTSKGFGKMKIDDVNLEIRYYNKSTEPQGYIEKDYYRTKEIKGLEKIKELLGSIEIDENTIRRCELEDEQAL